jgi:hypothetical protein
VSFEITCVDFSGLLSKQMAIVTRHTFDVYSHEGTQVPSAEVGIGTEYKQTVMVNVPADARDREVSRRDVRVTVWKAFEMDLEELLENMNPRGKLANIQIVPVPRPNLPALRS